MNITDGSHRTKYYLSGDAVTLEENGTDKIYYTYDADGDLISMNLNGKEYFYINRVLSLRRNFNFYLGLEIVIQERSNRSSTRWMLRMLAIG